MCARHSTLKSYSATSTTPSRATRNSASWATTEPESPHSSRPSSAPSQSTRAPTTSVRPSASAIIHRKVSPSATTKRSSTPCATSQSMSIWVAVNDSRPVSSYNTSSSRPRSNTPIYISSAVASDADSICAPSSCGRPTSSSSTNPPTTSIS